MKRRLVVPVAVCVALVAAFAARAAIPAPSGAIDACVKSKGQLYLVDPGAGQTCGKDAPLEWNRAGADGPQGIAGQQGFAGSQGTAGSSGYEIQHVQDTTDGSGDGSNEADCSTGKPALAGGFELQTGLRPVHTGPASDGSGWVVHVAGKPNAVFSGYVICATNGGP